MDLQFLSVIQLFWILKIKGTGEGLVWHSTPLTWFLTSQVSFPNRENTLATTLSPLLNSSTFLHLVGIILFYFPAHSIVKSSPKWKAFSQWTSTNDYFKKRRGVKDIRWRCRLEPDFPRVWITGATVRWVFISHLRPWFILFQMEIIWWSFMRIPRFFFFCIVNHFHKYKS